MDQQLQELKTKLAQLKGEQLEQQPAAAPLTLAEKEEADTKMIREVFASMRLSPEEIEEDIDDRIAKVNAENKSCPTCYRRQSVANVVCDLCGSEPERWLPGEERPPRQNKIGEIIDKKGNVIVPIGKAIGGHLKAHQAACWLRWAATAATVDELQYVVAHFNGPDTGWKIQHAARILRLLGKDVPRTFWGEDVSLTAPIAEATPVSSAEPADPPSIDFAGLLAHYDRKLAEINVE